VSDVADLPLIASGKVREMYQLGEEILMVASDRISTYDVVHPTPIPGKGAVLTGISVFWFDLTREIVPNHLISFTDGVPAEVRGRALAVRRLEMVPIECVVRGYITGSGWSDYQRTGAVCGIELPAGLRESSSCPSRSSRPRRRPTSATTRTSTSTGWSPCSTATAPSPSACATSRSPSTPRAAEHARSRGIILADTKFEFGLDEDGTLTLADEVLTPDSSRFWPADGYEPGRPQPSFDKQYVRDWAAASGWDKTPPAPAIPADVVERTQALYREAYARITGEPLDAWLERSGAAA
jgi:phosphoribosylaminoimidazole-succinocarboxamide synthase